MAVVIKMMSNENLPDANVSKGFTLITIEPKYTYEFQRLERQGFLVIKNELKETVQDISITGNCYVMDDGKTIATFAAARYVENTTTPQTGSDQWKQHSNK